MTALQQPGDFSAHDIARYRRQLSLSGFGRAGQAKLAAAHVAVIGAGGLGSPALLYLAGAGVGEITIIDDDEVSLSNLHRQVIHTTDRVGTPKAESAAATLAALNPQITVHIVRERLTAANAVRLLSPADVTLDGSDNFATRYLASWACAQAGIPHIWASILGFDAQMSVFYAGHGPIYEDLFPAAPEPGSVPSCSQAGVLGPVVGIVGSAMALEAMKVITGVGTPLTGTLAYFNALEGRWEYIPLTANPATLERVLDHGPVADAPAVEEPVLASASTGRGDGPAPGPDSAGTFMSMAEPSVPEVDEIPAGALVIDVREPDEVAMFAIPGSTPFPLGHILDGETPPALSSALASGRDVVLYCAGGIRSARAVAALRDRVRNPGAMYSLRGGIDAWLDKQA